MAGYVIITDTASDLPESYCRENGVEFLNLTFYIDEKEYLSLDENFTIKDFYDKMRNGAATKTSQVPIDSFDIEFTRCLMKGLDVLYIGFSSNLSGTYNAARISAEQLKEKFPERKIVIIDSLCASLGQGLLVTKAVEKKNLGFSIDELAEWVELNKLNVVHIFTVDDLVYLQRGGRVSKTAAFAGTLLGIKPILHVDNEGRLVPLKKIRGRKQALNEVISTMVECVGDYKNVSLTLSHADCIEEATFVEKEIKKRFGIKKSIVNMIGPVIGAHAGPGTIALFLMGEKR